MTLVFQVLENNLETAPLLKNSVFLLLICGQGSVVAIATGYGLEGPGIESR
jgi:hypothetical protein